jgi:hypothetical protein
MMYFIESVNTLTTTGKSRKGAILQAVAKRFEHTILVDEHTLTAFIHQLHCLVNAVNARYSGKEVFLQYSTGAGHIYANNGSTGHEAYIFSISYAPVGIDLRAHTVRNEITDSLFNLDRELLAEYRKDAYKEGGEL